MTSRRTTATVASERVRALSRTAYAAAAGHLEVDPEPLADEPARRRWALGPRVATTALIAVALLAVALGVRAVAASSGPVQLPVGWSSAQDALADPDPGDVGTPGEPDGASPPTGPHDAPAVVVVHVAGEVARPGVFELPHGSRVHEAVDAAGGAVAGADLSGVNLARALVDGEQVFVPAPGQTVPAVVRPGGSGDGPAAAGRIDLNTATLTELDSLPGIGPVLAQRILDWRATHGRFTLVEELTEVAGIGPTLLGRLRDLVVV